MFAPVIKVSKKKSKHVEYTKNDFEKDLVQLIKRDFLKKYQELDERFDVDRGKLLKAAIEPLLDTLDLELNRGEIRRASEMPAIILYRKAQPNPKPVCFIYAEFHFKQALIMNAENASRVLKNLFPGALAVFVALDKEPEKIKESKLKSLDKLISGSNLEECWTQLYEFLASNVFGLQ
ncbi:MAG: hypothetical protein QXE21_01775 [Candidatus Korarchaeota archaeon]